MRKQTNWNHFSHSSNSFISSIVFKLLFSGYADLLKCANFKKKIRILELGCGTGYITKRLCKKYDVEKATLVDSNKEMLDIAKKMLKNASCKKEFVHQDFFKFKSNEKYDLVHSQGVIEHFEDKKRKDLLKLHFNSTKKGGYCVIYSPTPTFFYNLLRKIMEALKIWIFHDEVPLKKEKIIKEMEELGAKTLKHNYVWRFSLAEVGIIFKKN
ncbi:MAG: class I SAM-dependent methyltransferase [Candidatus Nanoarchaeia archaeon]|nr:class I SAM-dependent methyltransferase [Candidatus Nanoarchaeia archaeon]